MNTVREPSRLVRIVQLKYKCFIIFVLGFVVSLFMLYTTLTEIMRDEDASKIMTQTFALISKIYFPNSSVDVDVTKVLSSINE